MDPQLPEFPPPPVDRFHRKAKMVDVVDGDTIDIQIDLGWSMVYKERARLESVNTPEKRGVEREAGLFVTEWVRERFPPGTEIFIASTVYDRTGRARGRYGRTIALVYRASDGLCLNQTLLTERLAWRTDDQGSLLDERLLSSLDGLPVHLRGG